MPETDGRSDYIHAHTILQLLYSYPESKYQAQQTTATQSSAALAKHPGTKETIRTQICHWKEETATSKTTSCHAGGRAHLLAGKGRLSYTLNTSAHALL